MVERNVLRIAVVLLIFTCVYHLLTLSISPVVWTDEVFFNSITLDWLQHGTFYCPVDLHYTDSKPVLAYGPLFFWLNGLVIKLFGNGVFQGRLLCLLSGILLLIWFSFFSKRHIRVPLVWLLGLVLLLLDPFYNAALHWARMDFLATLFFAIACGLLLDQLERDTPANIIDCLLTGALFAAATLCTPRMLLLAATPCMLLLWRGAQRKFSRRFWIECFALAIPIVVAYGAWIAFAFGNLTTFVNYYSGVHEKLILQERGFYLPRELYPLIGVALCVVGFGIVVLKRHFFSPVNAMCLVTLISYYAFVQDTGPYAAIVSPFYYLLIGNTVALLWQHNRFKRLGGVALVMLLIFNTFVFTLRSVAVVSEAANRKPSVVDAFIASNIPSNARVAGDVVYYYAVLKRGVPFHLLISYQFYFEPTAAYNLDTFDYDYIVLSERLKTTTPELYRLYATQTKLQPVDTLQTERSPLLKVLSKAGLYGYGGYDGVIYKRMR